MTEENNDILSGMDFDVVDDYKPEPTIPNGIYHGGVTNVRLNTEGYNITWDICLHDNGGEMSDDETPIDGAYVQNLTWLPKPGDESAFTKSGKWTKKQWKVNALAEQFQELAIVATTPKDIAEAIETNEWVGLEVDVEVETEVYQGKSRSKVVLGGMKKSSMF